MVRTCNLPYPANNEYEEMFKKYPFALSDFQKYAIEAIEKDKHILERHCQQNMRFRNSINWGKK